MTEDKEFLKRCTDFIGDDRAYVRYANKKDLIYFFPKLPPSSFFAIVLVYKGKPRGIAGLQKINKDYVAFSRIKWQNSISKKIIYKCGVVATAYFMRLKLPHLAVSHEGKSGRFLESLGYTFYSGNKDRIYAWQK